MTMFLSAATLMMWLAPAAVTGLTCNLDTTPTLYNQNSACDRAQQNSYRNKLLRRRQYELVNKLGASLIPNEKKIMCPTEVHDLAMPNGIDGLDTRWLVENTASTDVVVARVKDGLEYSAVNNHITPPHNDPEAVLHPGNWKTFDVFEGHVFHVREVLKDGTLGNVLFQHRSGLIPITKQADFVCDPTADPEPLVNTTGEPQRDPEYARTMPDQMRACNIADSGFRNEVGCPINAYWVGPAPAGPNGELVCKEQFKFHLGLNLRPNDFMWSWDSATKFEGLFVGNTLTFRLASDMSQLVGEYTMAPTKITDCPGLKQVSMVSSAASAIVTAVGRAVPDDPNNITSTALGSNRTLSRLDSRALHAVASLASL